MKLLDGLDTIYSVQFVKVFWYSFFWDHTSLLKSALRQSSSRLVNVKFAILVGFGLNFSVVYKNKKQNSSQNSKIRIVHDPDFTLKSIFTQHYSQMWLLCALCPKKWQHCFSAFISTILGDNTGDIDLWGRAVIAKKKVGAELNPQKT